MAEGIGLWATSVIDDDGGLQEHRDKPKRHERPTIPERHETRPPRIPKHVRLTTLTAPALAAPGHPVVKASNENTRLLGQPFYLIFEKVREGVTKTSEKSNRSDRSKSPKNLNTRASAPPNHPRMLQLLQSPRLSIRCPPCLNGRLDGDQDIENAGQKRGRKHTKIGVVRACTRF